MNEDGGGRPKANRFSDHYEVAYSYSFEVDDVPTRANLGTRTPAVCRFCRALAPVFQGDSHLIPAALGNRSLFSLEECHTCNDPWGSDLEDHLAKYLFLDRAVSRIRKRKGGVSYKRAPSSKSSVRSSPNDKIVRVEIDDSDDSISMHELGDNTVKLTAQGQPFSPMKVAKALARLGMFVAPNDVLSQSEHVRRWSRGEVEYQPYFFRVFVPGTGRRLVSLRAYRYIGDQENAAPYVVQLSYSAVDLIFPFPTSSLLPPDLPAIPFPGLSPYPPYAPTATRLNVLREGLATETEASITFRYGEKRELGDIQYVEEQSPRPAREVHSADLPPSFWDANIAGPVVLLIAGRTGEVLFERVAQIRLLRSSDDSVSIEVADDDAGWSVRVPFRPQARVDFTEPSESGVRLGAAIKAFHFRRAIRRGAVLEARNIEDHAPVLYTEYTVDAGGPDDLDGLARLYDRLEVIEQAFPGRLVTPARVEPSDVRSIELASSAIELGEFVDAPREFYEVQMNCRSVEYLEREFVDGRTPGWLKTQVYGVVQVFGEDLDLGPWHMCLERPRPRASVSELIDCLQQVPETDAVWVSFAADRCIMQFDRYIKGQ
jgi:hypothetical protein